MNLDALEEQVLGHARREMAPTLADSRRVHDAVVTQIGAGALGTAAGASNGGWFASLGAVKTALLLIASVGGMSSLAWWAFRADEAPNRVVQSSRPSVSVVASVPLPVSPPPSADRTSSARGDSQREHGSRQALPGPSPVLNEAQRNHLSGEVRLLKRADQALRQGAPDVASSLLNELATRYPNGQLLEERAATETLILCQRRRERAARAAAREFLSTYPDSVYAPRIRAACIDFAPDGDGPPPSGR
jgi:hypothetical protein